MFHLTNFPILKNLDKPTVAHLFKCPLFSNPSDFLCFLGGDSASPVILARTTRAGRILGGTEVATTRRRLPPVPAGSDPASSGPETTTTTWVVGTLAGSPCTAVEGRERGQEITQNQKGNHNSPFSHELPIGVILRTVKKYVKFLCGGGRNN